jgi:hypothetical protein
MENTSINGKTIIKKQPPNPHNHIIRFMRSCSRWFGSIARCQVAAFRRLAPRLAVLQCQPASPRQASTTLPSSRRLPYSLSSRKIPRMESVPSTNDS